MSVTRYGPYGQQVPDFMRQQVAKVVVDEAIKAVNKSMRGKGGYLNPKTYMRKSKRYGKGVKKGVRKKSNQRLSSDVKRLQSKITRLKKLDDATTGTLTYRRALTYRQVSSVNVQAAANYMTGNLTLIEAVLAQTKYFNPAIPGTLTTGSSVSGTYQRNLMLDYVGMGLKIRNNYQSPCELAIYLCKVRDDTNSSPLTAWQNSVADGSNITDETDLNQFPTDYNLVKDLWNLSLHRQLRLEAGESIKISHSESNISYDPATADSHNLSYQKEYKAFGFLIINKGVIAHDSSADQQGLMQSGIDVERLDTIKVKYAAGINITYTYIDNTYDTFTNTPQISNKAASAQQNYSL